MHRRFLLVSFCLALLHWVTTRATAQSMQLKGQYVYRHFTTGNSSLSTNELYKVIPDRNGYLWLATDKGLLRYDGNSFQQVTGPNVQASIVSVYLDSRERLWLFTYTGRIGVLDLTTQTVLPVDRMFGLDSRYNDGTPWLLAQESGDSLYLFKYCSKVLAIPMGGGSASFRDGGRTKFSDNTFTRLLSSRWYDTSLLSSVMRREGACPSRTYMIQTRNTQLSYYNQLVTTSGKPGLLFDGNKVGIRDYLIGFAFNGKDMYTAGLEQETLWLFPDYDLARTDSSSAIRLLQQEQVSDVAVDYLGNTWVSTLKDGLYLFGKEAASVLQYNREFSGLSSDRVTSFAALPDNRSLLGYANGQWDMVMADGRIRQGRIEGQPIPRNELQHIFPLKDKTLLVSRFYLSLIDQGGNNVITPFSGEVIQIKDAVAYKEHIYITAKGRQYICDEYGQIRDFYNGLNNTISICPVSDSVIYYGTTLGLYRNGRQVTDFPDLQINKVRYFGNSLLLATKEGLYRCRMHSNGRLYGKPVQVARQECADIKSRDGILYARTEDGILLLDGNDFHSLGTFNQRRFAIPVSINDYYIGDRYIYLSTGNGLFRFEQEDFLPGVVQDSIRIFLHRGNQFSAADEVIRVRYEAHESLNLHLDVLYYPEQPGLIEYKIYRDGEEVSGWLPASSNVITLTEPVPGRYRFAFRVFIAGNNRMLYYDKEVEVLPLWYQAIWCRIALVMLAVLLIAGALFAWFRKRLKVLRRSQEDDLYFMDMEARNRTRQLKPEHLSGLLQPLRYYVQQGASAAASQAYIDRFSALMQQLLGAQAAELTTLGDEIAFLREYLSLQQQRFDNSFDYTLETEAVTAFAAYRIPSLVIYPLVENAIEHGVQGLAFPGYIRVRLEPAGPAQLLLTVRDNGHGLQGRNFRITDHAIQLLSERLTLMQRKYGTGSIRTKDSAEGLEVMLLLPLLSPEA